MTTAIIPFDTKGKDVPAHLLACFGNGENIGPRVTINQLSYRGKSFRRVVDGEEIVLTRNDPDTGDKVPVQIVSIVVLDHNKGRSRAFYEGEYEEGKNTAPKCFSGDGVKPDASVAEPCAATCASCPNSVKGSKITPQGKQTTACAPYKRVAVVPSASVGTHVPLLLRLAQTSVWDKDNPHEAEGWYAWDQYLDMLRARGAKHTGAVETRVKFDTEAAYPKLLFSASRWLNAEEALAVKGKLDTDKDAIAGILHGKQSEDGMTGQPATGTAPAAAKPAAPVGPSAEELAAQAAAQDAAKKATAKAIRVAKAAADLATAQANAAAAEEDDGFGGGAAVATKPAQAATAPAAATAAATPAATAPTAEVIASGTPDALKSLIEDWDK